MSEIIDKTFWKVEPKLVSCTEDEFSALLSDMIPVCKPGKYNIFGKSVLSPRTSCIFVPDVQHAKALAKSSSNFNYSTTPTYEWDKAPTKIISIKKQLEKYYNLVFDYVLVNIYHSRKDSIGLHNDEEAMKTDIISVSLGSKRRFSLVQAVDTGKYLGQGGANDDEDKKGFKHNYTLTNGDVVHMKGPSDKNISCQYVFKHTIHKMNVGDLTDHVTGKGIDIPKGRKKYEILDSLIEQNNIAPARINLTFRKYE